MKGFYRKQRHFILTMLGSVLLGVHLSANAEPQTLEVDWSQVPIAESSMSQLSLITKNRQNRSPAAFARLKERLSAVQLPVYLPRAELNYQETNLVAKADFYDVSVRIEGVTLLISGDRYLQILPPELAQALSGLQSTDQGEKETADFTRAEKMVEVNFSRFGVHYTVTVECDAPDTDPRCTQMDFARQVYQSLVLVRGKE